MKVLMCDDQKEFLIRLEKVLDNILSDMKITFYLISFTDPEEALKYLSEYMDIDIVFMDILLEDKNGYEIAKQMRTIAPKSKIIFLSSTTAYALKGYTIRATRCLVKPIKKPELSAVLNEVVSELQFDNDDFIVEKNDFGIHKLYFNEIIYIETCKRNTLIHTISGDYISYKSMKEHQGKLNNNFIRCHSSYIVNMEYIKDYQGYEINLLNNDKIWVSKNRRKEFLHTLTKFYGKLLQ